MGEEKLVAVYPSVDEAEVLSIKVKLGEGVQRGVALFSCQSNGIVTVIKSNVVGVVKEIAVKEGSLVSKNNAVMFIEETCDHRMIAFNMCAICGIEIKSEKDVPDHLSMVPAIPQVTVNQQEAHKLGNKDKQRLLDSRKLALIVDLDQTLIHTSVDHNIERGLPDVYGFTLPGHAYLYHCRLRPHVRDFLQAVSQLFELHVFTMATKDYAYVVTKILDPEKRLFSDRVISRDECFDPHSKAPRLKSVFPCGDEMVAIIDDREDVWSACPNLVHVKPYMFFAGTADINAPPSKSSNNALSSKTGTSHSSSGGVVYAPPTTIESSPVSTINESSSNSIVGEGGRDGDDTVNKEQELDGSTPVAIVPLPVAPTKTISDPDNFLVDLQHVLTRMHTTFYNEHTSTSPLKEEDGSPPSSKHPKTIIQTPDLKEIIPRLRKSVFSGCNIVFSGVIPLGTPIERSREWSTARAFGGIVQPNIVPGLDSSDPAVVSKATTHLVVGKPDTNKYWRAKTVEQQIKIVTPKWFWKSAERWLKEPEENYPPVFETEQTENANPDKPLKHDEPSSSSSNPPLYMRKFSVSSEELEKMEAEIDAELSSNDEDDSSTDSSVGADNDRKQLGGYIEYNNDDDSLSSFEHYLGISGDENSVGGSVGGRKRKRMDNDGSSNNSTSLEDSDSGEDELARLLMM